MPIIETKWGTIKPESTKDMQEIICILNRKIHEAEMAGRWAEIAERTEFTALADELSQDAAEAHPTPRIEAELVFMADLDQRERENDWVFREYRYYKIQGAKYRVDPEDFPFGFDMHAVEWDGDEEERGGEWLEVKAKTTVYVICSAKQLAARKMK